MSCNEILFEQFSDAKWGYAQVVDKILQRYLILSLDMKMTYGNLKY